MTVPCSAATLVQDLLTAYHSPGSTETLSLASGCTYSIPDPSSAGNPGGAYYGTDGTPFDWYGPAGLPAIDGTITIEGNGATLEGGGSAARYRLIYVGADSASANTLGYTSPGAGSLTLKDLTLTGGSAQGGSSPNSGGGGAGMGGAIFNQGTVMLDAVTMTNNVARGGSSALSANPQAAGGGGLGTDGIQGGDETGGGFGPGSFGGAAGGDAGATGGGGGGGGFATNEVGQSGIGGFPAAGGAGGGPDTGLGGASHDPFGTARGGDGSGGGSDDGNSAGGAFASGGHYGGGGGVGGGGGGNVGAGGGFGGGGGNDSEAGAGGAGGFGGGGGSGAAPGPAGFGGGIGGASQSGNSGGGGAGMGGAVFNMQGSLTVVNSTLTANTAQGGTAVGNAGAGEGLGGAIFNLNGTVSLTNATLNGNHALQGATDIYNLVYDSVASRTASVALTDSVLTGSGGLSDVVTAKPADTTAAANLGSASVALGSTSVVGNLVQSGGGTVSGTGITGSPNLGPLANNGGPGMETELPGAESVLIRAGSCVEATDERGDPRPSLGATGCDIGAVEVTPPAMVTPPAPVDSTLPVISGSGKAGQQLVCAHGDWRNPPTGYAYRWYRDGTPIQSATGSDYTVIKLDEGTTLTCAVIASNDGGASAPATSKGFNVPVPFVSKCPAATGGLSGSTLGLIKLGMTRTQVTHRYKHSSSRGFQYKDFFCLTPYGVRVGLASPKLLGELPSRERHRYAGRVVWASTDNARYAVGGIRAGATLGAAEKALKHGYYFRVGLNYWYLAPVRGATAVLKIRHGTVEEVGIAVAALTNSHKADRELMTSFD